MTKPDSRTPPYLPLSREHEDTLVELAAENAPVAAPTDLRSTAA